MNSQDQYKRMSREVQAMYCRPPRAWNITVQVYTRATQVVRIENCFAVMFTNLGDTTLTVNGISCFPSATPTTALGDSRTIAAHQDDIYMGLITLQFAAAPLITPACEIIQAFYIGEKLLAL